ncbi:MAG TPA: hypothetical protein VF283_09360 [Bryobacteraceae bacterium]
MFGQSILASGVLQVLQVMLDLLARANGATSLTPSASPTLALPLMTRT